MSGQYHQYCSAHDEWLIMKLCMYVRYHTANNVSNFGGDSVTQLNLIVCVCVSGDMSPYCSAHDEWLIMKLCIYVRYHTANNVVPDIHACPVPYTILPTTMCPVWHKGLLVKLSMKFCHVGSSVSLNCSWDNGDFVSTWVS